MRMWMVDPAKMCDKHLLGEHGELHKFLHNWRKRHRIDGRIAGDAMEPESYAARHDALAAEMVRRGDEPQEPAGPAGLLLPSLGAPPAQGRPGSERDPPPWSVLGLLS